MRKPEKLSKPRGKARERPPADQAPLITRCEFCMKQFPDPTTARIHMDQEHPDAYSD